MDYYSTSLATFLALTLVYYMVGKPVVSMEDAARDYASKEKDLGTYARLAMYFCLVVTFQYIGNVLYMGSLCGGNIGGNIGAATLYTFLPWIFVFGIMAAALLSYPGLKNAFADVLGYAVVAWSAHDLMSRILRPKDAEGTSAAAATLIERVAGNVGLLVNDMHPDTFHAKWEQLRALMTPEATAADSPLKEALYALVVRKDNVGEASWLIATALFTSSLVFYLMSTHRCVKDAATIKKEHEAYLASLPPPPPAPQEDAEPEPW